jgi:hypothetical protein
MELLPTAQLVRFTQQGSTQNKTPQEAFPESWETKILESQSGKTISYNLLNIVSYKEQ